MLGNVTKETALGRIVPYGLKQLRKGLELVVVSCEHSNKLYSGYIEVA
jgi:hypothetical protein